MVENFEELKAQLQETQHKSVTDDLITRLESKLPKGAFGAPPTPTGQENPFILSQRIKQMEEETKRLAEQLMTIQTQKTTAEPSSIMVGTQETMNGAFNALKKIVDNFNTALEDWYNRSGCVVNFSWKYTPAKLLEIAGVDVIVYRKEAPGALTIKEAIENAPDEI